MPNWTNAQLNAIQTRGRTLLVSAGAGSGKTTVLTNRLLERIAAGESVTDFLVVTFTNASAADLREKLYEALGKLSSEHPEKSHYRKQLYLLPEADIGTIDSFCGRMVRAHFQLLGLSPKLRIADQKESELLMIDAMSETIEECYESGDPNFLYLADTFTGMKDDGPLLSVMLSVFSRLRAFEDGEGWLLEKGNALLSDAGRVNEGLFATEIGKQLQNFLITELRSMENEFSILTDYAISSGSGDATIDVLNAWTAHIRSLEARAENGQRAFLDEAEGWVPGKKMGGAAPGVGQARDSLKKELDDLISLFSLTNPAVLEEQFRKTGTVVLAAGRFLKLFEEKYAAAKKSKGILDFGDAEHMFLSLLEKDGCETEVCKTLRAHYHEIYIDEYQDVSPLQDRIFTLLSDGANRFMVGDVKQSIYRFRNAFPDIFLSYKDRFSDVGLPDMSSSSEDAGKSAGGRIFLRENFRSGEKILAFTNLLFHSLTGGTVYEREYAGEELVFARENREDPLPVTIAYATYDGGPKAEYKGKDAKKAEAEYIADRICELMRDAQWKEKDGAKRKCRYGDFALLFSALKNQTKEYEDALRARGIPYSVTTDKPFLEQPIVRLAVSLLRAIDDPTDDISLFGTMRSPLFDFTADEIYTIRKNDEDNQRPLIRSVRGEAERNTPLGKKCAEFLERLESFRTLAEGRPCHGFLWELYMQTGILYLGGERTRNMLLTLYETARAFESTGYKGLSGFLVYLRIAEEKGSGIEAAGSDSAPDDCVVLTTIHKSKGLEYPVVFLCNTGGAFNRRPGTPVRILRDSGMFFPLRDMERLTETDTILYRFAESSEQVSEFGETLRKLYVGCTRAKEKLYITGTMTATREQNREYRRRNPSSLLEMVMFSADRNEDDPSFEIVRIPRHAEGDASCMEELREAVIAPPRLGKLTEEQKQALQFRYPHETGYAAKITASELKRRNGKLVSETRESQLVRDPEFLSGENKERDAAHMGTANHAFLQYCDYDRVRNVRLDTEADRMVEAGMITRTQRELLDFDGLDFFFRSELFRRIRKSPFVRREMSFSVLAGAGLIGGEPEEKIVLQGLIDCVFEESDGTMTVVDYKTDRVKDPKNLADRYALQLMCYKYAVQEITGIKVGKTLLWSFSLDKEISVDLSRYGDLF